LLGRGHIEFRANQISLILADSKKNEEEADAIVRGDENLLLST